MGWKKKLKERDDPYWHDPVWTGETGRGNLIFAYYLRNVMVGKY